MKVLRCGGKYATSWKCHSFVDIFHYQCRRDEEFVQFFESHENMLQSIYDELSSGRSVALVTLWTPFWVQN